MAILKIISNASSINRGHSLSLAQTKSDGGIRKAQRFGPLLYNFEIDMNEMRDNSEAYYDIENEVMNDFNYGVSAVSTQMPDVEVKNRGTWAGSPKVRGSNQSGTSINLYEFTPNVTDIVKANDWVQFAGSTKVYQITSDVTASASGSLTITLNTPLIGTIADDAVVTYGNSVEFNLALVNPSSVDPVKTPASNTYSIAEWGTFEFEEVL